MRQAGRYLPEYQKVREKTDFVAATRTPEIAAELTMQPMKRFGFDAAILFSDIMTPLEGMGVRVDFSPGPVVGEPIRSPEQVKALRALKPEEHVPFVTEAVRLVRNELDDDRAVIGFAGAPFTLLCYLVEGSGSKDFMTARRFLYESPTAATALLDVLGLSMTRYLVAQARAGADALMLFDSWIGLLGPDEFGRFVLPVVRQVAKSIKSEVGKPVIYFARGGGTFLHLVGEVEADVFGIDWSLPLTVASAGLGPRAVLQGNLDPAYLFAPRRELGAAIDRVLDSGREAAAHIFNLGHGIHQTTNPDQVAFLVDRVRETSSTMHL